MVLKLGLIALDAAYGVEVETIGISDGIRADSKDIACGGCETEAMVNGMVEETDWGNYALIDGEVVSST